MDNAAKRVVFMTGAPAAADLIWNEESCIENLCPRLRRYLGAALKDDADASSTHTQATATATASYRLAKWREVPLKRTEPTPDETPRFLSFQQLAPDQPTQGHMEFLEHSLAVLQRLESSQIYVAPEVTTYDETTFVGPASPSSDSSTPARTSYGSSFSTTSATGEASQQVVTFTGQITDLKHVPTARHLEAIHPQTMTVNVLASVVSVQPTRTVRLRRGAGEMDIVEIFVGDDTRAGFTISFWLPPTDRVGPSGSKDSLKNVLGLLRSGDILLITHIALGTFNGNVYGQSLSERITRNNTSLTRLSLEATGLPASSMAKLDRVREWTGNFIGRPIKRAASPGLDHAINSKRNPILPPDTQPGES